ncbi:threonine/serine exporter family protein [Paenibacillus sp. R14(2021)]|uniref:threonine/serine exporter family protein n=1 Tax=Paenibacillus sp. R14(2021) TaxID=2859228 RepID=UPI001C6149BC|nr:threonine/serine exporter family protein [Paenibacillus sp. R14(2021)]
MDVNVNDTKEIAEICLLAGKLMLSNGAETYRVEDTMMRISQAYGYSGANSYVTPTAILFSIEGAESAQLARISNRTIRLDKVTEINSISRRISGGEITVSEAFRLLKEIEASRKHYPLWFSTSAAAIASGCFMIMYGGIWSDFLPAAIAGGGGYFSIVIVQRYIHIKFFTEFIASLLAGLLSIVLVSSGFGHQFDKILIGSVMPLVPGLLITNAVRDLMAGHLVSGLSKGSEAFLTAFAIGAGIVAVLSWLS